MGGHPSSTVCATKSAGKHAVKEYNNASRNTSLSYISFIFKSSPSFTIIIFHIPRLPWKQPFKRQEIKSHLTAFSNLCKLTVQVK